MMSPPSPRSSTSSRVYATGMSNGAMMALTLACRMPDKLAGVVAVAGPRQAAGRQDPDDGADPDLTRRRCLGFSFPDAEGGRGTRSLDSPASRGLVRGSLKREMDCL